MTATLNTELLQVLWACYAYWQAGSAPVEDRQVCFTWVEGNYKERFGESFSPKKLEALARLGYLTKADDSRAGHRRYYVLNDPEGVRGLTAGLDQT